MVVAVAVVVVLIIVVPAAAAVGVAVVLAAAAAAAAAAALRARLTSSHQRPAVDSFGPGFGWTQLWGRCRSATTKTSGTCTTLAGGQDVELDLSFPKACPPKRSPSDFRLLCLSTCLICEPEAASKHAILQLLCAPTQRLLDEVPDLQARKSQQTPIISRRGQP